VTNSRLQPAPAEPWPGFGSAQLGQGPGGALTISDDYLRLFLARPEPAPLDETRASERALHAASMEAPRRTVTPERLARLQDADARENCAVFLEVAVLARDNAERDWQAAASGRHTMLLDLSQENPQADDRRRPPPEGARKPGSGPSLSCENQQTVGHGLQFRLKNARSGLPALARVLERWVAHLLGVQVQIEPVVSIAEKNWRWHLRLDAESSALLNDLYEDRSVSDERHAGLISLFELRFANPAEMHPDIAGRPVYMGLAHDAQGLLRLKPQNLLLNLPLAATN